MEAAGWHKSSQNSPIWGPLVLSHPPCTEAADLTQAEGSVLGTDLLRFILLSITWMFSHRRYGNCYLASAGQVVTSPITTARRLAPIKKQ